MDIQKGPQSEGVSVSRGGQPEGELEKVTEITQVTERISTLQKTLLQDPKFKGLFGEGMFKDGALAGGGTLDPTSLSDQLIEDFNANTGSFGAKGVMFEEVAPKQGVDLLASLHQFEEKMTRVVDKFEQVLKGHQTVEDLVAVNWNKDVENGGSTSLDAPVGKVPLFMKELYAMGEGNSKLKQFCNLTVNFLFIVNKIVATKAEEMADKEKGAGGLRQAA